MWGDIRIAKYHLHFEAPGRRRWEFREWCGSRFRSQVWQKGQDRRHLKYLRIASFKAYEKRYGIKVVGTEDGNSFLDPFFCVLGVLQALSTVQDLEGYFWVTFHEAVLPVGIGR